MKWRLGPDGAHGFDRSTGLNLLLDEVSSSPSSWAQTPRQVSVALTNACELRCPYCYAPKNPAQLDPARLASWLLELDAAGTLGVGFGGGEPTAYRHLIDVCDVVVQQTAMACTMTTHGHRLTSRLIQALEGRVHLLRVSIDGVGETYIRNRGRALDALLPKVHAASQVLPVGINVVVNDHTVRELDALERLATSVGAQELLLLPQQPTGQVPRISDQSLRLLDEWIQGKHSTRIALGEDDLPLKAPMDDPLPQETAKAAYAHIDASGVLRTTSYAKSGITIGDAGVRAALDQLWDSEESLPPSGSSIDRGTR